jgi:transformation/transcription domain-associated protein
MLDTRPRLQPLALLSHYLTEFQYSKIDEIEVPGQYTEVRIFPA